MTRYAEDGRIDWTVSAVGVHNLVRAVAPPYPGAFTIVAGEPARILRTRLVVANAIRLPEPLLELAGGRLIARCAGGGALQVLALEVAGEPVIPASLAARLGPGPWPLGR